MEGGGKKGGGGGGGERREKKRKKKKNLGEVAVDELKIGHQFLLPDQLPLVVVVVFGED